MSWLRDLWNWRGNARPRVTFTHHTFVTPGSYEQFDPQTSRCYCGLLAHEHDEAASARMKAMG